MCYEWRREKRCGLFISSWMGEGWRARVKKRRW